MAQLRIGQHQSGVAIGKRAYRMGTADLPVQPLNYIIGADSEPACILL